tara:strand:+ start:1099 stop:1281 length:183 start_codon:yes stop_codon:yes gene_type:complete
MLQRRIFDRVQSRWGHNAFDNDRVFFDWANAVPTHKSLPSVEVGAIWQSQHQVCFFELLR